MRDVGGVDRRVLVVDDDSDTSHSLQVALTLVGFEVRVAEDGLSALETAATFRPHSVLLDLALPLLDGWEVAARLRANPVFRKPRLVAFTGLSRQRDQVAALAAGFDAFLLKPASLAEIQSSLIG